MNKPDFSEFLVGEKLEQEERNWARANEEGEGHRKFAKVVNALGPGTVMEFGCGTGWTASFLNTKLYFGLDANPKCIELAKQRVPEYTFENSEIRSYDAKWDGPFADVILCTAFLKHFGLHEWDEIFKKFMSFAGKYAVFTMQISDIDKDDGEDYHHTWITEEHLNRAITECNHVLVSRELCSEVTTRGAEWIFVTKRNADNIQPPDKGPESG